ncbi:MAG: hypothetical protein ABI461_22540 [Polyangiaceae bacterium]
MKSNLRFVSPLLGIIAVCSLPLMGCKRLAIDVLDHATEAAFKEASDGGGDVRIGRLPDDFPQDAPLDPKATVYTAASFNGSDGGWMAAFSTDESPEQVLAFYDQHMKRIDGDAGPALAMMSQMQPPGFSLQMNGLQKTQTASDQGGVAQTQVTTIFAFRTEGQYIVTTIHRDGPSLKSDEKKTLIFITVVTAGRPKG